MLNIDVIAFWDFLDILVVHLQTTTWIVATHCITHFCVVTSMLRTIMRLQVGYCFKDPRDKHPVVANVDDTDVLLYSTRVLQMYIQHISLTMHVDRFLLCFFCSCTEKVSVSITVTLRALKLSSASIVTMDIIGKIQTYPPMDDKDCYGEDWWVALYNLCIDKV